MTGQEENTDLEQVVLLDQDKVLASKYAQITYIRSGRKELKEIKRHLRKFQNAILEVTAVKTSLQKQSQKSKNPILRGSTDLLLQRTTRSLDTLKKILNDIKISLASSQKSQIQIEKEVFTSYGISASTINSKMESNALNEMLYNLSERHGGYSAVYNIFQKSNGVFPPGLPKGTTAEAIRSRINRHKDEMQRTNSKK